MIKSKELVSKPKEEEEVSEELAKKKSHGGEQGKLHKEIRAGVADMVHKAGASSGSGHERAAGTSVITLAGENKGASMNIGAKSKDKERHGHRLDGGDKGMTALINSNVQVINNSLLLQSSCSGGDPGVHLKLSAKSKSKDKQQQRASDGGGVE